jgi:HEPN domain-containing protein
MQNQSLANDYIERCQKRLKALEVLLKEEAFADVVREAQEIVELALKALLRNCNIEAPRTHDVSGVLLSEKARLPKDLSAKDLKKLAAISKALRKDRELAFYGSEDLTPSEFYNLEDAKESFQQAKWVVTRVKIFFD